MITLGVNVDPAGGVALTGQRVQRLEQVGLDTTWVAESYGFDSPSMLGYLAAVTSRVRLGAGIVNVFSRTPATIAMTAAGLDAASAGRFVLGLGVSGPAVVEALHGVAFERPVARLRATIDICRRAWAGEPVTGDDTLPIPLPRGIGTSTPRRPLKLLVQPHRPAIPIYVAGLGQQAVELAAEMADGWLPLFFFPARCQETWGAALRRGLARREPNRPALEIVAGGVVAIETDPDKIVQLRDTARTTVAFYVGAMGSKGHNAYYELLCRYGYEGVADQVRELFAAGRRADAEAALPEDLIEGITLVGPPEYIRDRLAAMAALGVTSYTAEVPPLVDELETISALSGLAEEAGA